MAWLSIVVFVFACFPHIFSLHLEEICSNRSVIAFGDSLTSGLFVTPPPRVIGHHSYTIELQRLFQNTTTTVETKGTNGEKTSDMFLRLPALLKEKREDPIFVIILGGTNDLPNKLSHKSILWHLKKIHNIVQQHSLHIQRNIYTIAMAIPQLAWNVKDSDRVAVNRDLKEYAERCKSSVAYLDVTHTLNQTNPENAKFWSADYVHFSIVGSDKVGHLIYKTMQEFIATKTQDSLTEMDFTSVCV